MSSALTVAVIVLLVGLAILQATIIFDRIRSDRRRRRLARARPEIEIAVADYVAQPDAPAPPPPGSDIERMVLREVAVEAIVELSGRERERVTELLEELGTVDELCEDIVDADPVKRRHAAEALAELRSMKAAEDLYFVAHDPDRDSRLAAARALAELGEDRFAEAVIDAADSGAAERPGAAAAVLLSVGIQNPDKVAAAFSPGRTSMLRRIAAAVVAELRLAQHAPLLRETLADEDDELVARACRGLGEIGDTEAVDDLLDILVSKKRPGFCAVAAAVALGKMGDPRAVPALERSLGDQGWMMRSRAADALARMGERGREALQRALDSPRLEIREQAEVALDR